MIIHGIGAQTYVWRQVYGQQKQVLEDHLQEVIADVAYAGCDGVVGRLAWMATDSEAERVANLLEKYHGDISIVPLEMPAFHHGDVFHRPEAVEETIARIAEWAARGQRFVHCPHVTVDARQEPGRQKTEAELDVQAQSFNRLGAELSKLGGRLLVHNHTPEIEDNARELRATCERTDPKLVNLCFDVHWAYRAGMDPLELIREYPERIKNPHLRNSIGGILTQELGEGDIDYEALVRLLEEIGYEGWLLVELEYEQGTEVTRPVRENLRLSVDYVRDIFRL